MLLFWAFVGIAVFAIAVAMKLYLARID